MKDRKAEGKIAFEKLLNITAISSNLVFTLFHLGYLILFFVAGYPVMGWINVASFILYLLLFIAILFKKYNLFAISSGVEITVYMLVATVLCGFEPGFHLCIIGLVILAFFVGYFSRKSKNYVKPLIWGAALFISYLFVYLWNQFSSNTLQIYYFPKGINVALFIAHASVVFILAIVFLKILVDYVLKLENRVTKESRTDRLTQIANRYGLYDFFDDLEEDIKDYCLAIFDIDDFKKINDVYGHLCGDYMLKEIAYIASSLDYDFVSRYGGEEFVIIVKLDGNYEDTCKKIDEVRKIIDNYKFEYDGNSMHSTITIGVANYNSETTIEEWIIEADKKLYEGKNSGKNKIVI